MKPLGIAFAIAALTATLVTGCTAMNQTNIVTPASGTRPSPREQDYDWMSRKEWNAQFMHQQQLAAAGDIDLLLIGDSITAGWPADLWRQHFTPLHAANFGIGGDHTGNILWRLQHTASCHLHPKLVVLLAGVNNLGNLQETPAQAFAGLQALLAEIRQKMPDSKILLLGVLPFEASATSPKRQQVRELNRMLATLADHQHVFFRDDGHLLLEPDGSISQQVMADYLHPTPIGYRRWASQLIPAIQQIMSMTP